MKKLVIAIFLLSFSLASFAESVDEGVSRQVSERLSAMAETWNAGNLDAFLKNYNSSDATLYIFPMGIVYGYNNIVKRYHKMFPAPEEMGHLVFSDISVKVLSANYAMVAGKWTMNRPKEECLSGLFTLLFEKTRNGWKIDLDHAT
jgi:hypothetical protein